MSFITISPDNLTVYYFSLLPSTEKNDTVNEKDWWAESQKKQLQHGHVCRISTSLSHTQMTLGRSDSRLTGKHYQPAWACDIPRTIYSISGVDFQDSAKSDLCMCPKIRGTVPKKTYVKIRFFPHDFHDQWPYIAGDSYQIPPMAPVRFTVLAPKAAALGIWNFGDLDNRHTLR